MKYKSREISILNLERLFSNTSSDTITIEEAYLAYERNLDDKEKNANWLSNYLTHLKHYDLVKTIYTLKNSRRVLDKIKLTQEGKRALGKSDDQTTVLEEQNSMNREVESFNFQDVMKIIARLRQDNPEFQITFDVKLKE